MNSAATMPMTSAPPDGAEKFSGSCPPNSTWRPACSTGFAASRSASTPSEPLKAVTGMP